MQIGAQTKISAIIKANKASIEAIASLAPSLSKLRNPLLRKLMASRVTLAEAAKIGGCQQSDLIQALLPLGFQFEPEDLNQKNTEEETPIPDWLNNAVAESIINFDVRSRLAAGLDPLKEIMTRFKQLEEKQILCIINSFLPTPLLNLLGKEKALTYSRMLNDTEYHCYFYKLPKATKNTNATSPSSGQPRLVDAETFEKLLAEWPFEKTKELDVRSLEMPLPMLTILQALEALPAQHALLVHHKRIPVFLLDELADKSYSINIHSLSENEVKMLLIKP